MRRNGTAGALFAITGWPPKATRVKDEILAWLERHNDYFEVSRFVILDDEGMDKQKRHWR